MKVERFLDRWGVVTTVLLSTGLVFGSAFSSATNALAQSTPSDFAGKTISVYIGSDAGGGYDFYGRLLARHFGQHVSGKPTVVPQNMPGAGSLRAANYLYNAAPKDGTAIGIITQTVALEELLGTPGVQYQSNKFNWIGRLTPNIDVSVTWHTSKGKDIESSKLHVIPVAGTGAGNVAEVMPRVLNEIIGTRFNVIAGYKGANAAMLAMERGEVDGAATSWANLKISKQDWLNEKKINIVVQYTPERHPELPGVPALVELGRTDEDKQVLALYGSTAIIGRSFTTAPDVPGDKIAMLRSAFDAMVRDTSFLSEIEKGKLEFEPLSGIELQAIIAEARNLSEAVKERARRARGF